MKCDTCFALTSIPTPKSSTPGLLLMTVRFRVPRAWRALMRFSGNPHRPKPPHMMVAPSRIRSTASAALSITLFMSVIILHQLGAPLRRCCEDCLDRLAVPEIAAQLREARDQTVERIAQRIRIGQTDVAPDIRRTGCESRRVDESATGHLEPVDSSRGTDRLHQCACGKLRKMADIGHHAIVFLRREDAGSRPETGDEAREAPDSISGIVAVRGEDPGASGKQIRARERKAAALAAAERVAADESRSR